MLKIYLKLERFNKLSFIFEFNQIKILINMALIIVASLVFVF